MSFIAVLGAGAIGGALAQRLAARGRTREVRLVDAQGNIARGKALDIQQSGAIDAFVTRVSPADVIEAVAGADVIVVADAAAGDAEHSGEAGLAMVKRLSAMDSATPLVFAGAGQRSLIARAVAELHVDRRRVIGSAPGALESAVRALTALELDSTGVEIHLRILGVPPHAAVVAWEEAAAFSEPVSTIVAPHRLAAISRWLPRLS